PERASPFAAGVRAGCPTCRPIPPSSVWQVERGRYAAASLVPRRADFGAAAGFLVTRNTGAALIRSASGSLNVMDLPQALHRGDAVLPLGSGWAAKQA